MWIVITTQSAYVSRFRDGPSRDRPAADSRPGTTLDGSLLPFIEHGCRRAQSLLVLLQLILRKFLHGDEFANRLVLQMDDAAMMSDIIIHWRCVTPKRQHALDMLQDEQMAVLSLTRVVHVMREPVGRHGPGALPLCRLR